MKVKLISYTPKPIDVIAAAASTCYDSKPTSSSELVKKVIGYGHTSVLEHASFTFKIEGISRACSHQLVRYRIASFSQQSQRYVKQTSIHETVTPESLRMSREALHLYATAINTAFDTYEMLLSLGVPKEDARYVLPNACPTSLVMTMNARELLHFFEQRLCKQAQWEIRELAHEMVMLCEDVALEIFEKAGPDCLNCKELNSCKKGKE